jgi:DNA/RNA-binding domain of Phe-tRNA-synthetase-like protein
MYFRHSPQIWKDFPHLAAGLLVIRGIAPEVRAEAVVESGFQRARKRLEASGEGQMPEIVAWRRTFAQMGLKPTSYRCAAESLLRRFRKEGSLPSFHPLVDLYNALSMAYAIPIAVYDIDSITGGIEVRYGTGEEEHLNFRNEMELAEPGEVVFADQEGHAHSRRWCFRQSRKSVVVPETTGVLIVAEAQHEGGSRDINALLDELFEACELYVARPVLRAELSASSPEANF